MTQKLLIVGCGNMGGAMLAGWLAAGEAPARFAVLDPALPEAPAGVTLYRSADEAAGAGHDAVLLSVYAENYGAQRFYQRYGFAKIADITFQVGEQLDAEFLYELKL